jgi:uncharacterized protein (DUF2147 family)
VKTPLLFILILVGGLVAAPSNDTPAGLWKTIDDKTQKPRGLVRIYEKEGVLYGRIESSFDGAEGNDICDKCPGERKNQPVVGLLILSGLKKRGNEYSGGEILDPDTGWVYRCRLTLEGNGSRLVVRGYLGLPVAGRSQTWYRAE